MKTKLMKIPLPAGAALIAALMVAMSASALADHRYDVVAQDRDGKDVLRYQRQHCGNDYDHDSHWYSRHGDHDHWCPGGPHPHR